MTPIIISVATLIFLGGLLVSVWNVAQSFLTEGSLEIVALPNTTI